MSEQDRTYPSWLAVIYYNVLDDGRIWLLIAYTKAKFDNLPTSFLNQLREEIDRG